MSLHQTSLIPQPVIETDRLVLRPLRASDVGLIELYASDKRVAEMFMTMPHPLPPGATAAFIQRATAKPREEEVWAIDGSGAGWPEVMGMIWLDRLDRNQSEIAYWVAPAFWNLGIASEVVPALVARNPLGNDTLFASVMQDNPASARILTNCGFLYLGDAEGYCLARGAALPTWTYSYAYGGGR